MTGTCCDRKHLTPDLRPVVVVGNGADSVDREGEHV